MTLDPEVAKTARSLLSGTMRAALLAAEGQIAQLKALTTVLERYEEIGARAARFRSTGITFDLEKSKEQVYEDLADLWDELHPEGR